MTVDSHSSPVQNPAVGRFVRLFIILLCSFIWIQDGLAQCVLAITKQPAGATKCAGDNYTFTVTNTGLATYQWQKDGVNLVDKAGDISGATTRQLTLTNLSATADLGNYVLVATGTGACQGQNTTSNVATLTVNSPAEITTQPTNQQTCENSIASFSVRTSGIVSGYQWFRNGEPINGATSRDYLFRVNNTLNGNKYKVVVTSSCGSVNSDEVTLTVQAKPTITVQPVGATKCVGDNYTFTVTATDAGSYQWQKGNSDLTGETGANLVLTGVNTSSADAYRVKVNGAGTCAATQLTSNDAVLVVNTPVSIGTQPTGQSVNEGATATFSVQAAGTITGYQWYRNGALIVGATNNTYQPTTSLTNNGDKFKVEVQGPCGNVTSSEVTLTVTQANTAPVATVNANQTATVGTAFTYTVNTFTDAETPNSLTYSASIVPANGLSFAPATGVVSGTPTNTGVSSVTVVATDPDGLSASTTFTITINPAPVVVTPLGLTLTANPTMLTTSGTTTLSATVSGGTTPYSYTFSGSGGTITPSGNTATVSNLMAGVQTFTVVVSDATSPTSQTISAMVSVTVTQANRPPTAPTFVNQTITVGTAFSYGVNAFTDPDGDNLNYSVSIDPVNGFSFDPLMRVIIGTPITTGVSNVTVVATDPGNLSTSATFTITVIPPVLIRYVKAGGTGDGSSWASASGDLQAMINAPGVQQVWVAGGIFRPTTTESDARRASFRMKNNVAIYGGFTGTETSLAARPPVNPVAGTPSSTTLSGDIGTPGDNSDNSYHVFYHFYDSQLNSTAVLDGVVIIDGNTTPTGNVNRTFEGAGMLNVNCSPTLTNCSLVNNSGGGIWNSNSSPTLTNCTLQGNSAPSSGGGIYNSNGSNPTLTNCSLLNNSAINGGGIFSFNGSSPTLTNCSLQSNSATLGGGIYNQGSSYTLTNCSLQSNSATQGGGIYNGGSNPTLTNCSLLSNSAPEGGGIYNGGSNPTLTNCVLWANGGSNTIFNNSSTPTATYSLFDNTVTGYTGSNNKTTATSPFASANPGTPASVALASGSPAIDAGSNAAYTTANGPATDLAGNARIFPAGGTIDMGAIESQTAELPPFSITGVTTVGCTPILPSRFSLSFTPRYSGQDGSPVSFSVINELLPTTQPGPYTLQLYTDNPVITLEARQNGVATRYTYNWLAACNSSTAPNTPPRVVMGIPGQTATVGQYFSYVIPDGTFTDNETPGSLRLSAQGLPPGLSFTGATLSGTPSGRAGSPFSVTITATDPGNLSVSTGLALTIQPASETPPPTAPFAITGVTTISCTPVANRISLSFTPRYAGLNGQPIAFEVVNETLPTTEPGPYSLTLYRDNPVITLRATQTGSGGPVTFAYNWLIACNSAGQDNTAPRLNEPVASQTALVGQGYSLNLSNTFIDQETPGQITLTAAGLPAGLSVSGKFISGTPSTSGESSVTLTATDGGGLSTSTSFSFTVLPASTQPPTNPPKTVPFSITGVTTVNCEVVSAGQRKVTFNPRYAGLDGSPVSFRVVNETLPTTNPGPYTLNLYTDNPVITLQATQSGVVSQFSYGWLSVCNPGARVGAGPEVPLTVTVLGNPVVDESVEVEVRGADGQALTLSITDELGHRVVEQSVGRAGVVERQTLRLGQVPAGVLLLRVSTPTQSRTVKVIKAQ